MVWRERSKIKLIKVFQRIIATTLATASLPLGAAVGFLVPSFFVADSDRDPSKREQARTDIFNSLLCQAIIGTIVAFLIVFFFRDKPPSPPSPSSGQAKDPFLPSLKALFNNKNVWLMVVIFGFIQGVFNTLGTVVGEIANEYGFTSVKIALKTIRKRLLFLGQSS